MTTIAPEPTRRTGPSNKRVGLGRYTISAGERIVYGQRVLGVVRPDGDGFELVAGFHRIAAAQTLGLAEVPVVLRDARTEDADRAVENIASCRCRHDAINADRVGMPTSV